MCTMETHATPKAEPCEGLMGPEANIKMGPLYKFFFIIVQYIFEKKILRQ